jgi:hypothetical protein
MHDVNEDEAAVCDDIQRCGCTAHGLERKPHPDSSVADLVVKIILDTCKNGHTPDQLRMHNLRSNLRVIVRFSGCRQRILSPPQTQINSCKSSTRAIFQLSRKSHYRVPKPLTTPLTRQIPLQGRSIATGRTIKDQERASTHLHTDTMGRVSNTLSN